MNNGHVFIDRFSAGLDDLKKNEQADARCVLRKLATMKQFSCFEASENMAIANTMTLLFQRGYLKDTGGGYPWTHFEITEAGKTFMEGKS